VTAPRATVSSLPWVPAAVAMAALAAGALAVWQSGIALFLCGAICLLCVSATFAARLPRWFLRALSALLIVYAVFGKGGAYVNVGGIFIGELVLAFGVIALLFGGAVRYLPFDSPLAWGIVAFSVWGACQTIPYVRSYGMDALRDAVTWGYASYALLVAALLARTRWTARVVDRYAAWLLWYPAWVPISWALSRFAWDRLPAAPGSDIPLVYFKAGDPTLHLVGVAAFVLLGLHQPSEHARRWWVPGGWLWWSVWLGASGIVGAVSRASMLAVLAGGAVILALRPSARLWRPVMATLALATVFWASGIRVQVRDGRFLSATDIAANALSIGGANVAGDRNATRNWRLEWWQTIVDYTIHGPYFWTGKGYGVNLARDDGYVVGDPEQRPLRSPHNGHLTILARSGVPGAVLWLVLQLGFAVALVRAYRRASYTALDWWARIDLWILACWVTFVVNAAFEVSLEGPQGGIWFWSLFGFGIAALRVQRSRATTRRARPRADARRAEAPSAPWRNRARRERVGA
jgi:hypothetical protein